MWVGLFIATMLSLFLLAGWVRDPILSVYATIFYKPAVGRHFDQDFLPVNVEFAKVGFTFIGAPQRYERYKCDKAGCIKAQTSDRRPFTGEFVANWKQKSIAFEAYVLQDGWHKASSQSQPIDEIYNNPDNDVNVNVEYVKMHGTTLCELSIVYFASFPDTGKTYVTETCRRAVTFFGGP